MAKKVRILSIDGGGIRGIIPGVILKRLEELLREDDAEARLADYFDFMAGTSTGGILVCAYLTPAKNSNRPKLSAEDAVNLYLDRGDEIFDVTYWQKLISAGGIADEKYSADELEEALKDNFEDTLLSELLKPCLITSYNIRKRKTHFFNSSTAKTKVNNFLVRDVARATSAAPTYFEAARIKSLIGTPYPLIDGGVFANNPAMCAYAETRTLDFSDSDKPNKPRASDMYMVSIGTGSVKTPYYYKNAKNWGQLEWIKPVIDIMMSANSETVHYQLKKLFEASEVQDNYVRMEPELLNASSEMDNASMENLTALKEAGLAYIEECDDQLREVVEKLKQNS